MKKTMLVLPLLFILTLTLNGCGGEAPNTTVSDTNIDEQGTEIVTKTKVPVKKVTSNVQETNNNTEIQSEISGNIAQGNTSTGNPAKIKKDLAGDKASDNNFEGNVLGGDTSVGSTSAAGTTAGNTNTKNGNTSVGTTSGGTTSGSSSSGGASSGSGSSGGTSSGASTSGGTTGGGTPPSGNTSGGSNLSNSDNAYFIVYPPNIVKEINNFDSYKKSQLKSLGLTCSIDNAEIMAILKPIESEGIYEKTLQNTINTKITVYRTANPNKFDTDSFNIMFEGCTVAGKTLNLKAYENYLLWNYDQCSAGTPPEKDQEGFVAWKKCSNNEKKVEQFFNRLI